ncbi:serine/threonine-protein phosphatase 7 long form homolog [Elaeis guineensis]|uniref:serine/threonine-protein phosphatase 7 long form homolog n=1 Tax=Elaeis guineensis var. tenera TaxID=51953 RepID=UPI003C6D6091
MLQDVAVLLGLRVHGPVITSTAQIIWSDFYEELFGIKLSKTILSRSSLRFHWLRDTFHHLPNDADDETMRRHARAFILCFISGHLFADKFDSHVQLLYLSLPHDPDIYGQLSWGNATLVFLYRKLYRATKSDTCEIAEPLVLR